MQKEAVLELLSKAKVKVLEYLKKGHNFNAGVDVENYVFQTLLELCPEKKSEIKHSGPQTFPDIVIDKIGVEVKLCQRDSWKSIGNSIMEGTGIKNLEITYLFFLKQGGSPDVRIGEYQNFLADVVVTHSPRYEIDMTLKPSETIFSKMNLTYAHLDTKKIVKGLKEYYVKQGKEVWWISPSNKEETTTKAYLRKYADLTNVEKERFIVDSLILFPEIFSNSRTKFKRASIYLLENFECLNSNFRDIFTAGGRCIITVHNEKTTLPHIYALLQTYAKQISEKLKKFSIEELSFYWNATVESGTVENKWLLLLSNVSKSDVMAEVYASGLRN